MNNIETYFVNNNLFLTNFNYRTIATLFETLTIEISNDTLYLKLNNLQSYKFEDFKNYINSFYNDKIINEQQYLIILNFVATELIKARVNYELFIKIYNILVKKEAVDFQLAQMKMLVK